MKVEVVYALPAAADAVSVSVPAGATVRDAVLASGVLERHPELRVVVDHGAKPRVRDGEIASWAALMATIAVHPQVSCKLSGLVTEAPPDADLETLRPYVATLLELFGPRRLLWGSDWPVVELAGGYDRWHNLAREALSGLDAAAQADVFGGNAERVYLDSRRVAR